ncbi:MAG: hypothetical protein RIC89_19145 [Pseudomonadales bacterium]
MTPEELHEKIALAGGWTNRVYTNRSGLSKLFGVTERTIGTWVDTEKLPAPVMITNRMHFDLEVLAEWLTHEKNW